MRHSRYLFATLSAITLMIGANGAFAEKTNSDMIPPDVTLPAPGAPQTAAATNAAAASTPAAPEASAPGMGGQAPGAPLFSPQQAGVPQPPPSGFQGMGRGKPGATPVVGAPASTETRPDPLCILETQKGTIVIRLFRKQAPKTVAHFMQLVQQGFYNGLAFHRVEPGFVIQGGCPNGNGSGLYTDPKTNKPVMVPLETSTTLSHNAAGVVAMARFPKNPNSGSCQFYITLQPQPRLDHQYSIFGGVLKGMDVVQKIQKDDKMTTVSLREQ